MQLTLWLTLQLTEAYLYILYTYIYISMNYMYVTVADSVADSAAHGSKGEQQGQGSTPLARAGSRCCSRAD
ncbi:hypothetical protein T492DRAFT_964591 [Pavlovales sp. CCMP2436]|nr:hypothetical protein T492DRAFT_964591 [Pavlovales sp. CCMP2436]